MSGNPQDSLRFGVKGAAASLSELAGAPNYVETPVPPVEENFDAPPRSADEIAEHAAANVQPTAVKKRPKRK